MFMFFSDLSKISMFCVRLVCSVFNVSCLQLQNHRHSDSSMLAVLRCACSIKSLKNFIHQCDHDFCEYDHHPSIRWPDVKNRKYEPENLECEDG